MTTQTLFETSFTDPVTGQDVAMSMTYDDVTLAVLGVVYVNPSAQPGQVVMTGPAAVTFSTVPAVAVPRTVDLSAAGVSLVKQTVNTRFGPRTVISLPDGQEVQFSWAPAAGGAAASAV